MYTFYTNTFTRESSSHGCHFSRSCNFHWSYECISDEIPIPVLEEAVLMEVIKVVVIFTGVSDNCFVVDDVVNVLVLDVLLVSEM